MESSFKWSYKLYFSDSVPETIGKTYFNKNDAFNLVVRVALGSTLATIFLNKQVSLAEGLTAYALLIGLYSSLAFSSFSHIQ